LGHFEHPDLFELLRSLSQLQLEVQTDWWWSLFLSCFPGSQSTFSRNKIVQRAELGLENSSGKMNQSARFDSEMEMAERELMALEWRM
jgi:hypothetical protein